MENLEKNDSKKFQKDIKNFGDENFFEKIKVKIFGETINRENIFGFENFFKIRGKFIKDKDEKKHNFNTYIKWFFKKIKMNNFLHRKFNIGKWSICLVDFGMNVGNEINGIRPALVIGDNKNISNVFLVPISSFKKDSVLGKYDILVDGNNENGLKLKSILKIEHAKFLSKKRFKSGQKNAKFILVGKILNEKVKENIRKNISEILK